MSVACGRPPSLTNHQATSIITNYFTFKEIDELSIVTFPSYRDRNYFFQGECAHGLSKEFVFKLSNPLSTSFDMMEAVNQVLKHLNSRGLLSPYPLSSRTGTDVIELSSAELLMKKASSNEGGEIMKYPVYVLSFIPGEIFDHVDKKYLTPALLYQVGELLAKIDKDLMESFPSPSFMSGVSEDWNMIHFPKMKRYLMDIPDLGNIENAEKVIMNFEVHVCPKLPSFRRSIIHGDLNGLNIVLKDKLPSEDCYQVAGFIDYNDSTITCTIFELGISLAHIMCENLHPVTCSNAVEFVGPMIRAYNSILPLSAEELDCLYYLVLARCVQVAINAERYFAEEPWNHYIIANNTKMWENIDYLLSLPKQQVDKIWF